MNPKPSEISVVPRKRISDEELRTYTFYTSNPESEPNYSYEPPPETAEFEIIEKIYNIPHKPRSREGFVWCAFCAKRTHYVGGLAKYSDGLLRSVGWCCCQMKLGEDLKEGFKYIKGQFKRSRVLLKLDDIYPIMSDLLRELDHLAGAPSINTFGAVRRQFSESMRGVWNVASGAAFHEGGELSFDVTIADYSKTSLKREGKDAESDNGGTKRLQGQSFQRHRATYQISGWEFADPKVDLSQQLNEAISVTGSYLRGNRSIDTDSMSTNELRGRVQQVQSLIAMLETLERLSQSLPAFFSRENMRYLAEYRNSQLDVHAYVPLPNGMLWKPAGADEVRITMPSKYTPIKIRALERLRRAIVKD